jgi:hypothetical protein
LLLQPAESLRGPESLLNILLLQPAESSSGNLLLLLLLLSGTDEPLFQSRLLLSQELLFQIQTQIQTPGKGIKGHVMG